MKKTIYFAAALFLCALGAFAQQNPDSTKTKNLEEVHINAFRASTNTPIAFSNLSRKELTVNNFGQDLPTLLSLTPSLITTSDAGAGVGYSGIRIRGTDANRVNITINGIPVNDAESHNVYWVNMPDLASSVSNLQIQRGVGSSTNGAGAFGASINMSTETLTAQPYNEVNVSYGSFNTSKLTWRGGTGLFAKNWAIDGRLSKINSDGYIQRAKSDLSAYFVQAGYYSDFTILKLISFGGQERTYHAWNGVPKDSLATNRTFNPAGAMALDANYMAIGKNFYPNQTDNYTQTNHQLHLIHSFDNNWSLNAAIHYTKGLGYFEEYAINQSFANYGINPIIIVNETITASNLIRRKWLDNNFIGTIFSVKYADDKIISILGGGINYYDGLHFGKVIGLDSVKNSLPISMNNEYYRSTGKKADANIYSKTNYQITNNFSGYLDIQFRHINYAIQGQNGEPWDGSLKNLNIHQQFNFLNPKTGFVYQLNENNRLFTSVAIGNREPTRASYTTETSEIPKSEHLTDYELGYNFSNKIVSLGVNLYQMNYKNQLVLNGKTNAVGEVLTSNVPESFRQGIEISLGAKITSWLKWTGNLTLSNNRITMFEEYVTTYDVNWAQIAPTVNSYKNSPIAYSPNISGNSNIDLNFDKLNISLQTIYVGKQYIDNTGSNDRALPAYTVNNIRIGYSFKVLKDKTLAIGILANNILNELYSSNALISYSSYTNDGKANTRYDSLNYFTQATSNFLINAVLKF